MRKQNALVIGVSNLEFVNILLTYYPKGLKDILKNWNDYRLNTINTGKQLSWENRTKDLLEIYKRFI